MDYIAKIRWLIGFWLVRKLVTNMELDVLKCIAMKQEYNLIYVLHALYTE
jgi:hypothetical protein